MRVLHLADLHVEDGPRLAEHRRVVDRIIDDVHVLRPHLSVLVGDFYGRATPYRSRPREREIVADLVLACASHGPVVIVYGNHDAPRDLDLLRRLSGDWPIHVVSDAAVLLCNTPAGQVTVAALAYPTKASTGAGYRATHADVQTRMEGTLAGWAAACEANRRLGPVVACFHGNVEGATLGGGEVLHAHEPTMPVQALAAFPANYIALGHIHKAQRITGTRAWYPGSPWWVDLSEQGDHSYCVAVISERGDAEDEHVAALHSTGRLHQPTTMHGAEGDLNVYRVDTVARPTHTLEWVWGPAEGSEAPTWLKQGALKPAHVAGADVRLRLITTQRHCASAPWQAIVEAYEAVAASVQVVLDVRHERVTRAPQIAAASTVGEKLQLLWDASGATAPQPPERVAALDALSTLQAEGADALVDHIRST